MNLCALYNSEIPSFLDPYLDSASMQRLKGIDMNCGMNFTSFPFFHALEPYSRYDHSLGVALIVWHFTNDKTQTLSGLFHDISTPAFSHVVDFMKGDYIRQEANENETLSFIANDPVIMKNLIKDHISPESVSDYHQYPIADNDSPCLSADRLEYTCGDIADYHLGSYEDIRDIYEDLIVTDNEKGVKEISFQNLTEAEKFTQFALTCGHVYSCKEDRYAMDRLSDLLKACLQDHTLSNQDLYASETEVIRKICHSPHRKEWDRFSSLSRVDIEPEKRNDTRQVHVKKRFIDPYVFNRGRVSELNTDLKRQMIDFRNDQMDEWLKGDTF